jgi:ethanolamine transporter EutH
MKYDKNINLKDSEEFDLAKTKIMYKQIRLEGIALLIQYIIFILIIPASIYLIPLAFKYQKMITGFGTFMIVLSLICVIIGMISLVVCGLEELFTKLFNIEHYLLKRILQEYNKKNKKE